MAQDLGGSKENYCNNIALKTKMKERQEAMA